jgi:nucleoside-diphosphate-sugar epimerase
MQQAPAPGGRVVVAGGSGFLGRSLVPSLLGRFDDVVVLTRGTPRVEGRVRLVNWDARTVGPWAGEVDGAGAVVNLVGRTVDCRKTPANRKEILESRVDSVRALAGAAGVAPDALDFALHDSRARSQHDLRDTLTLLETVRRALIREKRTGHGIS